MRFLILVALSAPTVFSAQLQVCNTFNHQVEVAVAVHENESSTYGGAGWIHLSPYDTAVLWTRHIDPGTKYLVSVVSPNGQAVAGPTLLCTSTTPFSYPNYAWHQPGTCVRGFLSRSYNALSVNTFCQNVPLGTDIDSRGCKWPTWNPQTHRIEGYAYSDENGPAPNQKVVLRRTTQPQATSSVQTGSDGKFTFQDLQYASYTLGVESQDYDSQQVPVVVNAGQDSKDVTIKLVEAIFQSVSGTAYFPDGKLAAGQNVFLRRVDSPATGWTVLTGADGTFAFPEVRLAAYNLNVDSPGYKSPPVNVVVLDDHRC